MNIKPFVSQQGLGIAKITMLNPFHYEIHFNNRKVTKTNMDEAYDYIKGKDLLKKSYIVRERLPLAEIDGCPIDIRVITQKEHSSWKVTEKIVKVAGKDFFITNAAQKLLNLDQAIQSPNLSISNNEQLEYEIDRICIYASKLFEENHPDIHIIGFDIGISPQGDIWIFEGNYKPNLAMFFGLEEKDTYIYKEDHQEANKAY
ncbi:YheC/D like ATP-grasp [Bacillus sp. OV322]|nr:YheC/D like ATP-grasp [Bacillus sp. OV322]